MCMKCFCGSEQHGHDSEHAKEYQHPLMIRLSNGDCWCFECKCLLPMDDARMRNVREWSVLARKRVDELTTKADAKVNMKSIDKSNTSSSMKKRLLNVHGLRNLCNTCFFNASMQALSVSRSLQLAIQSCTPASLQDHSSPLTAAFIKLLDKMQDGANDTIVPSELHNIVCRRWKQFKGFRQQDAHELLRCLLDGLREDERKAMRHTSNDESTKKDEEKANKDVVTFVDQSFGGRLVSVVMCETCKTCSYAYENALDIAVPISGQVENNNNDDDDDDDMIVSSKRSKHQRKMDHKKKGSKSIHRQKRELRKKKAALSEEEEEEEKEERNDMVELEKGLENITIEDENESNSKIIDDNDVLSNGDTKQSILATAVNGIDEQTDTSQKAVSMEDTSIEQPDVLTPPVSSRQQQLIECLFNDRSQMFATNTKQLSITTCLAAFTQTEHLKNENQFACEACWKLQNPNAESEEETESSKESSNNDNEEETSTENISVDSVESSNASDVESSDDEQRNQTATDALGNSIPIAKRSTVSASSTGTTTKKVTPRYVLRDARKRFLICHPAPRVLMIQLKRFEQTMRGRTRKIERHVELDEELELSPFMAPPNIDHEDVSSDVPSMRYRLIAVVEQMGGLIGGHYVAHILVPVERPTNKSDQSSSSNNNDRSWVYCSDGQIRPSSWEEVSRSQAYIAFYECIQ
ncbi:hypothetical protein BDF22DRAFT_690013 [Syncephalis plumigaleata]|nr:hypothetical protein BDF22DRAFT_690013 [Syncephalis plumigaleata]